MNAQPTDRITVYRPNQRHELGLFATWAVMARNVWNARELIWQLFKRDFLASYKKSFIGFTWIFLSPIIGILNWVFLNAVGVLEPGDTGDVPYPAYVMVGSAMWGLFLSFYRASSETLTSGSALVLQVNYPHEALLFKQVAQQVANFSLSFVTTIVVVLAYGVMPSWKTLLLPLVVLPLFFLASAIGLIFSMTKVVAIDLDKAVTAGMALLLYSIPVVYSDDVPHPLIEKIIRWNPLTYLICSPRDIITHGRLYDAPAYFICAGGALVLFLIAWRLFYVSEHKLVERMI